MYLGFCKQVLWPSFHNVDLLDLAMNGWGQRQRDTNRSDPVRACQLAAEEARERKRSESACTTAEAGGAMPMSPHQSEQGGPQRPELKSDWDQRRLDSWWNAYVRVNETFSRVVADLVSGGDIVWVHDYHLALLPRMLREARNERGVAGSSVASVAAGGGGGGSAGPRAPPSGGGGADRRVDKPVRMIFFIHVPFPTSQVFRELEHGEALLEGMLHADLIGFHAFDHARHFLNAAKRILGLTYESLVGGLIGVRYRGTKVVVAVSNVSVEADIIDALLEYPSVAEEPCGRSIRDGPSCLASPWRNGFRA
jgi:trehalose 6-phosphate synthase/phosphatase